MVLLSFITDNQITIVIFRVLVFMTKPFALHIMSVCAIVIHVQSVLLSVSIYNNEMECIKKNTIIMNIK